MKRRIGIFGGTFNPPHLGHIEAAKSFQDSVNLDTLIIMPTYIPPHKGYNSSVTCDQRLEMCRLAFKDLNQTLISDHEIKRGGTSYTYLTLQEFSNDDVELFFLCGTDMILTMDLWKNPEIIFRLSTICYVRRENDEATTALIDQKCNEYLRKYGARIIPIKDDVIEISSSAIRENSELSAQYLKKDVEEYIRKERLYQ